MNPQPTTETKAQPQVERVAPNLYRRGGQIVARVRVNGKATWRSTGTSEIKEAKLWLRKFRTEKFLLQSGVELPGQSLLRQRVTVAKIVADYIQEGCPTRTMQPKKPRTVEMEKWGLERIVAKLGDTPAAALAFKDADEYKAWRVAKGFESKHKLTDKQKAQTWSRLRTVDMELGYLSNALSLAVRRGVLRVNPLAGRSRFVVAAAVRHCRDKAPTPKALGEIEKQLRNDGEHDVADFTLFVALTGLRLNEARWLTWEDVSWGERLIHVKREKDGVCPWAVMSAELETLLRAMQGRSRGYLLFPSPLDPKQPRDASAIRSKLRAACKSAGVPHVCPHGLRAYFVTRCREAGLGDFEIAGLIGQRSGPQLVAQVYGQTRPEHVLAQARMVKFLSAATSENGTADKAKDVVSN
jgi:integrase